MSTEPDLLYQVDDANELQEFVVLLGVGTYINVANTMSREVKRMENRTAYRDTPEKAWVRRVTLLGLERDHAKEKAIRQAKHLAMLNRITAEYSRKEEDLKNAQDRLEALLDRILDFEALLLDAQENLTCYGT